MHKSAIIVILILAVSVMGAAGYYLYKEVKYSKEPVPEAVDVGSITEPQTESATEQAESGKPQTESVEEPAGSTIPSTPEELNLKMTFYAQAPFGNWDYPWQETCEEASALLIANEYLNHGWTAEEFNDELLKLVEWENNTFGDYKHTNVKETVWILNEYLGLKTVVYDDPTLEDVQKVLARGHFIVMPFAGKHLGNPYYKNGGPVYHMLVVKGYKAGEKIITNDVGTRKGEDYVYSWKTISTSMHDYAQPIEDGAKRMIEVIPPSA